MLTRAEEYGGDDEMEFADEPGTQKLLNSRNASTDADVFSVGGRGSALHGGVNAIGDEVESGLAFHRNGGASVVGQYEDGSVVRGIFTPPTVPGLVRPGPTDGPKHVASEDPGTNVMETTSSEIVIDSRCAAVVAMYALKSSRCEGPLVQSRSADSKRVFETLTGASTITVEGNAERLDSQLRHERSTNFK